MGILDSLRGGGSNKELEDLRREIATLKNQLKLSDNEKTLHHQKYLTIIDKTHAFMERLKILVGTLEDTFVLERCWDLLDLALVIKKGAIYRKTAEGWLAEHYVGFREDEIPVIPLNEDSLPGYVAETGAVLSLAHLRKQDDLAYLERRGVVPDCKIVCPVRIDGEIEKLIIICNYAGNVFTGEDDIDTVNMVATLLGLVLSNSRALAAQKSEFEKMRKLFSSMVAPEVIELLEKSPEGITLGGERRQIAILFVDIRDFTALAKKITPEQTVEILNRYFTLITEIVLKNRGTLDKFMGDSAMVLFGTPNIHINPSLAAVQTAMQIQRAFEIKMPQWATEGFPEYGIGIGINFADVIVGNVGSTRLSNFTAVGDGVNIASRLCHIAKPGEVLITGSCYENIPDWPGAVEERFGVAIKGSEALTVFSLEDAPGDKACCPQCGLPLPLEARFCGECGFRRA
jgi:class 3 adenylate cyclase